MIRYVLAALLTVGLFAVAMPAIDRGGTASAERDLDATVAAIDEAASTLAEHEEVSPDGHPNPRRVVDVALPRDTLTTTGVDHLEIVPSEDGDRSHVRYVLADGTTREAVLSERIVWNDPDGNEAVELGGAGERRLALVLNADEDGEPVVVARRVGV